MALKLYQCTNVNYCTAADTGKTFELPDLGNPACPECSLPVIPVKAKTSRARALLVPSLLAAGVLLTAGMEVFKWRGARQAARLETYASQLRTAGQQWLVDPEPYVARLNDAVKRGDDPAATVAQLGDEIRRRATDAVTAARLDRVLHGLYRGMSSGAADARLGAVFKELEGKTGVRAEVFAREADPIKRRQQAVAATTRDAMESVRRADYPRAASLFEKIVAEDSENPWPQANLCGVYAELGKPTEAGRACDRALQLDPDNWLAHYNRACVAARRGDSVLAVAELAQAAGSVDKDPARAVTRDALLDRMKRDPTLAGIRNEAAFKRLLTGAN